MNFIDIHNHVMHGIDDGSKSYEETVVMLKAASKGNIKKIIITPHFKEDIVENKREGIKQKLEELKEIIKDHELDIEVYPGCEIFLSKKTSKLLSEHKIQTLNDSKYILVETHRAFTSMIYDLKEELYNLNVDGYNVILAHPERYEFTYDDLNFIYELVKDGHYMQINVSSLDEKSHHHKIVKQMLNHNLVHFIASDAHDSIHRPLQLQKGYDFIKKHYSEQLAQNLFYNNPLSVIENKSIETGDIKEIKKKKWFIF